jgi:phosphoribosylanthranilate isomerase
MRVKICGVASSADIEACVWAGADAVGFVFAQGPRQLTIEQASVLSDLVPPYVTSVGVFAGNSELHIRDAIRSCRLDVLQFSDALGPEFCGSFGKPTIAVIRVGSNDDVDAILPSAAALRSAKAVGVMVDAHANGAFGGSGLRVNEKVAQALARSSSLPFILAGGLSPENVSKAVSSVRPWAVDVSSGVELAGKKDRLRIKQFVDAARTHIA